MSIIRDFAKFIEPTGQLEYDNTNSGLSAATIKSAIDEINVLVGGGNVGSQATFSVYEFVAAGGQTVFNLSSTFTTGLDVTAGDFVTGTKYTITATNTTDFTLIGAADSNPGTVFEATGPGTGTGTAKLSVTYVPGYIQIYLNGIFLAAEDYNATDGELLTLTEAAEASDLLSIVVLDSLNMALLLKVTNIDSNAPENLLSVDSSGNVGIGTNAPSAKLESSVSRTSGTNVSALVLSDDVTGVQTTGFGTQIRGLSNNGNAESAIGFEAFGGTNNDTAIAFYTQPATGQLTRRMTIDKDGAVGIGTDSPAADLHVTDGSDSNAQIRINGSTSTVYSRLYSDNNGVLAISTDVGNQAANSYMMFEVKGTERMRIDASGSVGIGGAPEAWNANSTALDIGSLTTLWNDTSQSILSHNVYKNVSGLLAYRTTAEASYYEQNAGNHIWYNAISGTNDADITTMTERARIDTSGNFVLPDNGKAIFGAGSDLQIYHDGTNSYISDQGTNDLKVLATDFQLKNAADSEFMMTAVTDGAVTAYHNGSAKLATTATGIDVTGSVTADGLTVDGDAVINQYLTLKTTDDQVNGWVLYTGITDKLEFNYNGAGNAEVVIDSTGKVGIGNSAPLGKLTISNAAGTNAPTTVTAANTYLQLGSDDYGPSNNGKFMIGFGYTDATNTNSPAYIGYEEATATGDTYGDLTFYTRSVNTDTAPTERMRIDSAGRVLINKTLSTGSLNLEAQAPAGFSVGSGFYSDSTQSTIEFKDSNTTANYKVRIGSETDDMIMFSGGSESMRIDASGNVGIGRTSLSKTFEVEGTVINYNTMLVADSASGTTGTGGGIGFQSDNGLGTSVLVAAVQGIKENSTAGDQSGALVFAVKSPSPYTVDEAMRIDSSGSVGIGTTDPSTYGGLTLQQSSDTSSKGLAIIDSTAAQSVKLWVDGTNSYLSSGNTGADPLVLNLGGGSVGIGTDDVTDKLTINANAGDGITFDGISASAAAEQDVSEIKFINRRSSGTTIKANIKHITNGTANGSALTFGTTTGAGAIEAMRIDALRNLLVGKTATNNSVAGVEASVASGLSSTVSGDTVSRLNRLSNDGEILRFQKDTAAVGNIGVKQSDAATGDGELYVASGNTGLFFDDLASPSNYIRPCNATGALRDNIVDLGKSDSRFKDLYLSGSVVHTFDVINNGTTDYQFSDAGSNWFPTAENDPILYLRRGETYIFSVVAGGHPFEIRVSNGGAAYTTGVTNNGAQNGDVVFKVPMSAPATLYYQCTVHSGMGNIINIV